MFNLFLMMLSLAPAPQAEVNGLLEESSAAGIAYAELFQKKDDADIYTRIAAAYKEVSKPLQARIFYKEALKLDPQKIVAKEGLDAAEERITFLKTRLQHFDQEIKRTHHYQKYCSKAAILFHMGESEKAIAILEEALENDQTNGEVLSLKYTFEHGLRAQAIARERLEERFSKALEAKQLEPALQSLGQLIFIYLGKTVPDSHLNRLGETFASQIDKGQVTALLKRLSKQG